MESLKSKLTTTTTTTNNNNNNNSNGHIYSPANTRDDNDNDDDVDASLEPAECGIWRCKPRAMRACASMSVFTGVYSFSGLLTSTLSSYVNSQVSVYILH
jgi:hypothetical protein